MTWHPIIFRNSKTSKVKRNQQFWSLSLEEVAIQKKKVHPSIEITWKPDTNSYIEIFYEIFTIKNKNVQNKYHKQLDRIHPSFITLIFISLCNFCDRRDVFTRMGSQVHNLKREFPDGVTCKTECPKCFCLPPLYFGRGKF